MAPDIRGVWPPFLELQLLLWLSFSILSTSPPPLGSAPQHRYRGFENIGVQPVVVTELKFRDTRRHVPAADLVERANDAALENRPETLNRLRVNRADDILMSGVVNGAVI